MGGGGGADSPSPSDLGHGAIMRNYTLCRVSPYEHAEQISKLKIKALCNYAKLYMYVNYMHDFVLFLIIHVTDKIRRFGASNCLEIVVETFNIFLK